MSPGLCQNHAFRIILLSALYTNFSLPGFHHCLHLLKRMKMRRLFLGLALLAAITNIGAQSVQRPKLVVGIVVDQMRWDYLYRYYNRYSGDGGFKRFLNEGFTCENTFIPYTPTITACGHTCIYTGSVPAFHGITGNTWWDNQQKRQVYCAEDTTVKSVGSNDDAGRMSPKNMLTNTVCDELKLATNFRSKVVGIAIKDRGGILPAGHSADAAYWYNSKTGDWISSTYYMNDLPKWVKDINSQKQPDKYFEKGWNTLYPIESYTQSTEDENKYENKPLGKNSFPYDLKQAIGKNYGILPLLPYGNTFTADMAKAVIINEGMGKDSVTDFLTVSFSTPDYIGHNFGPNSIEQEDDFLRLDKDLGDFFKFLDKEVGAGQYTVFLSADHGAAHVPAFVKTHKMPGGNLNDDELVEKMNKALNDKFGKDGLIEAAYNYQIFLNHDLINSSKKINLQDVQQTVVDMLVTQPGIARAFILDKVSEQTLPQRLKDMVSNGYFPRRSGDIQVIFEPQWIESFLAGGTTHGLWNPYDSHIPLLWYGWGIKQGKSNREMYMTDIAPTISALLHIQMPNGNVGKVIEEVMK